MPLQLYMPEHNYKTTVTSTTIIMTITIIITMITMIIKITERERVV